jgi:hypothetical protein
MMSTMKLLKLSQASEYQTWLAQINAYLQAKGLYSYVSETIK